MTEHASVPLPANAGIGEEDLENVMLQIGTVCGDIATASEWLQDQLGALVNRGSLNPCRETSMALQELDRIAQVLRCLSHLNCELALHASGRSAPTARLREAIGLESLADRLLGSSPDARPEDEFWS